MHIPDWVPDAVFYQIFPERFSNGDPDNDPPGVEPWGGTPTRENYFGGDLEGVIQKLDYVVDLGIDAIYLNPIFEAGTNHKYDTHDYFRIDPAFGDDATFDRLIREAHHRGIRIVLDGVFNHCGDGFGPFRDVMEKRERSRYRDWFTIYGFPITTSPHPSYATCGGAHYLPRLNMHNPEVEEFIHSVALHWLGRGIDGWRLDVPYEIHTDFWRRFRAAIKPRYPDAYLVAEEWRDPSAYLRGDTFDGATHYLLRNLAFDFFVSDALTGDAFARALDVMWRQMPEDFEYGMLTLLGSHDTPRLMTVCGGDGRLAGLLCTFLLTMPGAPMIYYGDEIGMEGGNDPDCRRCMEWDAAGWEVGLRRHVQRLIEIRKERPSLRRGDLSLVYSDDRILAYERTHGSERILVVLNNARMPRTVTLPAAYSEGAVLGDLLCSGTYVVKDGGVRLRELPPRSGLVLAPKR